MRDDQRSLRRRSGRGVPRRLAQFVSPKPELDLLAAEGTEAVILDAARRCLMQYGSAKMSMVDVARVAGVSRGSVYNYFPERDALVEAVAELAFASFAADMDDAMNAGATLEDQIVAAARTVRQWDNAIRGAGGGALLGEEEVAHLITRGSEPVMRRMIEVVQPYLDDASARGELRDGLDTGLAAEWIARILHSLSVNPAVRFDADDPEQLDAFIRSHLLYGLAVPSRSGRLVPG